MTLIVVVTSIQMFIRCISGGGAVTINPIIVEKINAVEAPDVVKEMLHDILKTEDRIQTNDDQRSASTYMGKILIKYADGDEVVKFCEKW